MGLLSETIGRARANGGAAKAAPAAFAALAVVVFGLSYFAVRHSYGERLSGLEARLASQEALLADYRTRLRQAAPGQAAAQIKRLTLLAADLQSRLDAANGKLAASADRLRDPQHLYEDNSPIARVHDPKVDLSGQTVTFPLVTSGVLLATDKPYQYRQWKLICGGTQSYSAQGTGAAPEFDYSHLICRIVGSG
jgi:hypothetical protein